MTDFELKKYIKLFPFKIKHTLYIYIYINIHLEYIIFRISFPLDFFFERIPQGATLSSIFKNLGRTISFARKHAGRAALASIPRLVVGRAAREQSAQQQHRTFTDRDFQRARGVPFDEFHR